MTAVNRRSFLAAAGAVGLVGAADNPGKPDAKPKFRLGLVTYLVGSTWDLKTLLSVCQSAGISPVELRTEHKHGVEVTLSKEKRKEVRKQFADAGVAVWGCGSTCDFHHADPAKVKAQIELCKRFVELAADIGGKGVKVRPNGLPKGVETKKTLAQIGQALVPCGQAASEAGVEIWVEVHGNGTSQPGHMKTIMDECGHKAVGVTWNSNPTDLKGGSVAEAFKLLWPWFKSCHINALYNDAAGRYPYRELFGLLRGAGYDRATLIEVGQKFEDAKAGAEYLRTYKALWQELARG